MGRRSRRSASNVISAAILEVFIMGLFVIIAQPQLRDALMGILHVSDPPQNLAAANANAASSVGSNAASANTNGGNMNSSSIGPTGSSQMPRAGSQPGSESAGALGTVSQLAGMAASALQGIANATAPANTVSPVNPAANDPRLTAPANAFSSNAPLEHYESFRVTVPPANAQQAQFDYRQALPSTSNRLTAAQDVPSLSMVPLGHHSAMMPPATMPSRTLPSTTVPPTIMQSYSPTGPVYPMNQGLAPFATGSAANHAPTQLTSGQWNIASANQSPSPVGGWNVIRPHETSYQEPYPPPYGTQSQWK